MFTFCSYLYGFGLARGYFIVCTLCNAFTSFYGLTIDNVWLDV